MARRKSSIETLQGAKLLVSTYYSLQKERVQTSLRIGQLSRDEVAPKKELDFLHDFMDEKLKSAEDEIKKEMDYFTRAVPIHDYFLKHVKGIGPILSAGLISSLGTESPNYGVGIARFETISKLWAYAGQHTVKVSKEDGKKWFESKAAAIAFHKKHVEWYAEKAVKKINVDDEVKKRLKHSCWGDIELETVIAKRKAGQTANWSPFLKTLCWKIGESFVKAGGYYRDEYDHWREFYDNRDADLPKAQRFARAKRKAIKLFLSDLWRNWREMEGLPTRNPYIIEKGGHTGLKLFSPGKEKEAS